MFCLRACCCLVLLCSRVPSPAVLSCPFSCCALVSLLLLCCACTVLFSPCRTHTPLLLLHVVDGPNSLLHSLARALSGARHIVPSTFLCVVSLDRSVAFPVQSLQRTEFIRHIFFNPISFISFFLSFFLHWCSRLRFGDY